ncbi:response regulator (plasmid) [Paraburkholderia sp. 22B1P]|uniref:response regulator transcription factor n=1 Tax=Paraburkholderia sp. 22B1P TaxID=3080498 RepID=UPI0030906137|nr:response regulator [Paraburkholderia sp. 22B1P]
MTPAKTVCVVDDDESVRSAICNLFRSLDFITVAFECASDFLVWISINDAVCIISDVQMPGMSGIDMYRQMRSNGKDVPTIFLTAYPNIELKYHALTAGALAYLAKPVDIQELTVLLEHVVQCRIEKSDISNGRSL